MVSYDQRGLMEEETYQGPPIDVRQFIVPLYELLTMFLPDYADIYLQSTTEQNQSKKQYISSVVNAAFFVWTKALDFTGMATDKWNKINMRNPDNLNDIWFDTIQRFDMVDQRYQNAYQMFVAVGPYIQRMLYEIDDGHIADRIEWSENLGNSSIVVTVFCLKIY